MATKDERKAFEEQLLAGSTPSTNEGSKRTLIDLLHQSFGADDLVKIKNFTSRPTGWVYSDHRSVEQGGTFRIEQPNEFTRRVWQGEQKARVLDAGKTIVVPGWEAYVGLVRFFKQYVQEEYPGESAVRMNSPAEQNAFFKKAFVGVYDPNEEEPATDVKAEVEKDLGLKNGKAESK